LPVLPSKARGAVRRVALRQCCQGRAPPPCCVQYPQDPAPRFFYDSKRLIDLSRCGWESLKTYFTSCSKHNDAVPGAVVAIQTFEGLLGYNPHLHVLIFDGCFHKSGMLTMAPAIDTHALEQLFRHKVLVMLLSHGRITKGQDGSRQKRFERSLGPMSRGLPKTGENGSEWMDYRC
jgi:hypothetical protein